MKRDDGLFNMRVSTRDRETLAKLQEFYGSNTLAATIRLLAYSEVARLESQRAQQQPAQQHTAR